MVQKCVYEDGFEPEGYKTDETGVYVANIFLPKMPNTNLVSMKTIKHEGLQVSDFLRDSIGNMFHIMCNFFLLILSIKEPKIHRTAFD